jgi:nucleoside 2-deoxyribosyltransferase
MSYLKGKTRSHIYVAGPIGPDAVKMKENATIAIRHANNLRDLGFHPFVPHLCVWWHEITPRELESWMEFDFAWLQRCDAVLRITGHSPGSDREVEFARSNNIPVFFSIGDLLMWARK